MWPPGRNGGSRCPECEARRNTLGVPPPYGKFSNQLSTFNFQLFNALRVICYPSSVTATPCHLPLWEGCPPGILFWAGAGALSAKHEEIPLGYPHPTVNSQTNFPLSIFNSKSPPGYLQSLIHRRKRRSPFPSGKAALRVTCLRREQSPRPTVNWLLCGTVRTVPYGSRGKRADNIRPYGGQIKS